MTKINIFAFRDRRQTAFVMLNVFCPLSNPFPPPALDGQNQTEWNTKQN